MKKLLSIQRFKFYFWVGFVLLVLELMSDLSGHGDTFGKRALDDVWRAIYFTVINYVFFEYTAHTLSWKKFWRSALRLFIYFLLFTMGMCLWISIGSALHIFTVFPPAGLTHKSSSDAAAEQMAYGMASVFFFGIIWHIYNHIKLKQSAQQLHIEKQQAELSYLKSQTNPHFLFNTLNNIYSLARDKSDLAPESIMRLSKILRYMLYETTGPFTAIEQDLKIIDDYIALEKLRYDDSLRVNFNYDIEDMKQALPPLLLIPLVENAFKHGASETRGRPFVDIHLSVKNRQLSFFVKNSTGDIAVDSGVHENIGLSNLRRQLELLFTDYNLSVQQVASAFTATLKINLASHV